MQKWSTVMQFCLSTARCEAYVIPVLADLSNKHDL